MQRNQPPRCSDALARGTNRSPGQILNNSLANQGQPKAYVQQFDSLFGPCTKYAKELSSTHRLSSIDQWWVVHALKHLAYELGVQLLGYRLTGVIHDRWRYLERIAVHALLGVAVKLSCSMIRWMATTKRVDICKHIPHEQVVCYQPHRDRTLHWTLDDAVSKWRGPNLWSTTQSKLILQIYVVMIVQ